MTNINNFLFNPVVTHIHNPRRLDIATNIQKILRACGACGCRLNTDATTVVVYRCAGRAGGSAAPPYVRTCRAANRTRCARISDRGAFTRGPGCAYRSCRARISSHSVFSLRAVYTRISRRTTHPRRACVAFTRAGTRLTRRTRRACYASQALWSSDTPRTRHTGRSLCPRHASGSLDARHTLISRRSSDTQHAIDAGETHRPGRPRRSHIPATASNRRRRENCA